MTQSDVSTPTDGTETTRSALATGGRNATEKERSGRGAASAQAAAVQLAELEEVDPRTVLRVAITTQLEPSDHPQLGQMITFAAGLDVSAIIWITTRIGEEHRAVLDWLNQHGDDDVRFFGVEVRLLRIGNSAPAVTFNVEARPNDWQKVVKQRQRVGSPLNSRMREF